MKYTIKYTIDDNDIEQMLSLDKTVFEEYDTVKKNKIQEWVKVNPDLYTVIKFQEQIVGYINFMPITKLCYDKFYTGQYKDYKLKTSDIMPFKKGADNFCLFLSIVVRKDLQDTDCIKTLTKAFFRRLKNFKKQGINIVGVVADCVSVEGVKYILKQLNGVYVCNSEKFGKVYYCDIYKKKRKIPKIKLLQLSSKNYKIAGKIQYELFNVTDSAGYIDYIQEVKQNNKRGQTLPVSFLIYYKHKPVGVVGLYEYDNYKEDIWLNWFGVLPKYREQGVGTNALIKIIEFARRYNKKYFRLYTYQRWYIKATNIYRKLLQVEELYANDKDKELIDKYGECKIFSTSLHNQPKRLWNNKYINLGEEKELNRLSKEKLLEDKII